MMINEFPPALILIVGALVMMFSKKLRPLFVLGLPILVLMKIWSLNIGDTMTMQIFDLNLIPLRVETTGRLFATIFAVMAFTGGLFALNQKRTEELVAAFIYAGSAIGVTLAGDLVTIFVFWEIMAVTSTLVILSSGTKKARKAAMRYLMVHILGGCVLLSGIAMYAADTGSILFENMTVNSVGTWLMLIGVLINTAAPPLSAWLSDAYPEASFSGTVFLSAFTTKTAVYVLLCGFAGAEILIYVGLYMACYGIVYALLENDMRRILSYGIVNGVGFMVCGVGIGTEMALNGVAAYAVVHILYKALLLMSAGSVLFMTGKRKCTELGGLFQSMPITTICAVIGALSISFPFTAGFISKSMITQAAADGHMTIVWFALMAGSAGVFLSIGLKYVWFVFFQKDSGLRPKDPPLNMQAAMVLFSAVCIGLGFYPELLYKNLPYAVDYEPYSASHIVTMLQLLLFTGLSFFMFLPIMKRMLAVTLDLDWLYRCFIPKMAKPIIEAGDALNIKVRALFMSSLGWFIDNTVGYKAGRDSFTWILRTCGSIVWIMVLLVMYLLMCYA